MTKKRGPKTYVKPFKVVVKAQYAFTYRAMVDVQAETKPEAEEKAKKMFLAGGIPMDKPDKGKLIYVVTIGSPDYGKIKGLKNSADNTNEEVEDTEPTT